MLAGGGQLVVPTEVVATPTAIPTIAVQKTLSVLGGTTVNWLSLNWPWVVGLLVILSVVIFFLIYRANK